MKVFLDIEENLAHGGNQGADDGRKRSEAVTKQLFWLYDEKKKRTKERYSTVADFAGGA